MNIIQVQDYEEMSEQGAEFLFREIMSGRSKVIGLATGGTPVGLYKHLVEKINANEVSLTDVHTVNLDEYIGLSDDHPNSYHQYMFQNLFQYIDIPSANRHLPSGTAADFSEECRRYERLIQQLGGVDTQLLGIGANGHIAFNEPGSPFDGRTRVVDLAPATIEANSRYFNEGETVPSQAVTMGIGTIMESGRIVMIASGKEKAAAVKEMLTGEVTEDCPATVLQKHDDVTLIADAEALSEIDVKNIQ
ncbi:glucosamine-6-phosphate deaminase [Salisediminibacterium halotolerans]|uniref:Glucosamine-6-phosphate deaminase n=1 Tax=Salisediminibacterium halotolerans TaxID=517425 RepID=A0A1H9SM21_9BACI|nr:glucosamine-6-phosphate deaminase [Salisediminibacterium haloalkalitolerans]SER85765.1 glucosamine-6-phosphate deaminase [Salisediminibacterium haloalkalitolerans]